MTNGKYSPYPSYKSADVDWVEELPEHWEISKLRYLFTFGKGLSITKENLIDVGVPCVNYGEVHSKYGFEVNPEIHLLKCVPDSYLEVFPNALLSDGDIVFADTSEDIEGAGNFTQLIKDNEVFAGYHTIIARPASRECSRFYAYLLDCQEIRTQVRHAVKGVKVFSITQAILRGINVWLPSVAERTKIANFLDHETTKIDTLIEKQQQLIKLLKEKRQAVISHAVTKGLNPNAPMRDSGVEWLGEVPEHWEVIAISKLSQKITNGYVGPTRDILVSDGVPYVQATHIKKGKVNFDAAYFVRKAWSDAHAKSILRKGDVLIVQTGAGTGDIGLVSENEEGYNCHALIIVQPIISIVSGDFLSMALQSQYGYSVLYSIRTGGMHPHLNCSEVQFVKLPVPPREEQDRIIEFIYAQTQKYDKLIDHQLRAIELMQERRTALISAAVTGKIDVRDCGCVNQLF